jgi:ABC-2 type transport system permease protein
VLVLGGLVILAAFIARRFYYTSWLLASDARAMRGPRPTRTWLKFLSLDSRRLFPAQIDVFVKRDFWLFFREPSQWLHMLLMIVLLMVFIISLGSLELKLTQPLLQVSSFLVVFLFNGFLISSLLLRFVFPAVSLEGDTFWSVRAAPVSLNTLYLYKMLFSLVFVLIVSQALSIASTLLLRNDPSLLTLSAGSMAFVAVGLTGLNLGAGAYFATYREKNPIRVASSQGASLTFLASMLFLTVISATLLVPLKRYFDLLILRGVSLSGWIQSPIITVGVISLFVFAVSTAAGLRAIRRDI